jgi:hypothetical protein
MKSNEKSRRLLWLIVLAVVAWSAAALPAQDDPILKHYRSRAAAVFDSRNPWKSGAVFSFEARTVRKDYVDETYVPTDSLISRHWYSFGQLDSQVIVRASDDILMDRIDFKYPNVFERDYQFNFFPNDTGGEDLALGFEVADAEMSAPAGLAVIDRDYYFLRRLYLYYPDRENYRKYSRSFHFIEEKGMVIPDSMWVVASRPGLITDEHFRLETDVYNIRVEP